MYNLNEMIGRIKTIKKSLKLSNEDLAVMSGIPKGTLAKILGSETKDPQISNIIKIAQALDVTTDYLIYGETRRETTPLSTSESSLLSGFRSLNEEGQDKVLAYIDDLNRAGIYKKHTQSELVQDA